MLSIPLQSQPIRSSWKETTSTLEFVRTGTLAGDYLSGCLAKCRYAAAGRLN